MFDKHAKQIIACNVLNQHTHGLLFGGSRSGKTTIIIRNIILRALKVGSRHLICRFRFNHAKTSMWYDTLPKVFAMCFPGVKVNYNKSDWFISFEAADGKESQIWIGGVDDKERVEKILGNEYSTVFANEVSQISYEAIEMLRSRLAENSGLRLKFYYDLNPCGKKHWTYQEFVEGLKPGTKEKTSLGRGYAILNPHDNQENLPEEYFDILDNMSTRQRQRFRDGLYLSDVEGALWTDEMVANARAKKAGTPKKTVVAVDPAVSFTETSDAHGIVVCSIDEFDEGIIHRDLSLKCSTMMMAQTAVNAYHKYEANCIVAEVNQGGDLVEDAIKGLDSTIKVVKVRASKGKFARAEPVASLYEQGKVSHETDMLDLESEQTEYVPETSKKSPDRLDAAVWGLTYLMLRSNERIRRVMVV